MKPARIVLVVLVAAAVVLAARTAFFIVDRGEAAVVTQFGKPVRVVDGPGLYLKAPLPVQAVETYDTRLAVWDSNPTEYATADSASVILTAYAAWKIEDPGTFALAVRTGAAAEQLLADIVVSEIGTLAARHPLRAFASTQETDIQLPEILRSATRASTARLAEVGIAIVDLGVTRIDLPERARDLVIERMIAEQDARATLELAAGQEEAARVRAAADSERQLLLADSRAAAERIRAEADAEAVRIYAEAGKADPAFFKFVRTLDSYRVIMNGRTTVVLSSDSELFRLLDEKD